MTIKEVQTDLELNIKAIYVKCPFCKQQNEFMFDKYRKRIYKIEQVCEHFNHIIRHKKDTIVVQFTDENQN